MVCVHRSGHRVRVRVRGGLELIEDVLGEDAFEGAGSTRRCVCIGQVRSGQVRSQGEGEGRVGVNRGRVRRGCVRGGRIYWVDWCRQIRSGQIKPQG